MLMPVAFMAVTSFAFCIRPKVMSTESSTLMWVLL